MFGSLAVVVLVISLIFDEAFLVLDLSSHRSIAWYLSIAFVVMNVFRSRADHVRDMEMKLTRDLIRNDLMLARSLRSFKKL